ncbi:MAG: hypothetical protein ACI4EN_08625 [Butyrivibrio sp.]
MSVISELQNRMPYTYILNKLLPDFRTYEDIKVCDFSRSTYEGGDSFRIVFAMPKHLKISELHHYLDAFFTNIYATDIKKLILDNVYTAAKAMDMDESLLMQIGVETDEKGNILCIKYYIRLRCNTTGPMEFNSDTAQLIHMISNCAGDEKEMLTKVRFLQEHGYNPIFVGINISGSAQETKLYFVSDAFGFRTQNVIKNTNAIADEYGFENRLTKRDVELLFNMGLYVQGAAFSVEKPDEWKLYINALPRKKV